MVLAILTKPLDGQPEGAEREFDKADFERLKALGAVRAVKADAEKAAPEVQNKVVEAPANKADPVPLNKGDVPAQRRGKIQG